MISRLSFLFFIFYLSFTFGFSQEKFWEPVGPDGGNIKAIAVAPNGSVFVGANNGGIYRSLNKGESWERVEVVNGTNINHNDVGSIKIDLGGIIYALIDREIERSTDNGGHWIILPPTIKPEAMVTVSLSDSGLVFVSRIDHPQRGGDLSVSTDHGDTWKLIRPDADPTNGFMLIDHKGTVFFKMKKGIVRSTDLGKSWSNISGTTSLSPLYDDVLYYRESGGTAFISINSGDTWERFPYLIPKLGKFIAVHGIIFSMGNDFRASSDSAKSFLKIKTGISNLSVNDVAAGSDSFIYAGTNAGVLRSDDRGKTWMQLNSGIHNFSVPNIVDLKNGAMVARMSLSSDWRSWQEKNYRSTDEGKTWTIRDSGKTDSYHILTADGKGNSYALSANGLSRSEDGGKTWSGINNAPSPINQFQVAPDGRLYCSVITPGNHKEDIYYRADRAGKKWEELCLHGRSDFLIGRNGILFTSGNGITRSKDGGKTCKKVFEPHNEKGKPSSTGSMVMDNAGNVYVACSSSQHTSVLYRSTDGGNTWKQWNILKNADIIRLLVDKQNRIYAATNNGIFRCDKGGGTWEDLNVGMYDRNVQSMVLTSDGYLMAGTSGGGLFRSINPVQ